MRVAVEVKNRTEAKAIKAAMDDPEVRAFVLVMGELLQLPSARARIRVLKFVEDFLEEEKNDRSGDIVG